jgi:hypothetical protein
MIARALVLQVVLLGCGSARPGVPAAEVEPPPPPEQEPEPEPEPLPPVVVDLIDGATPAADATLPPPPAPAPAPFATPPRRLPPPPAAPTYARGPSKVRSARLVRRSVAHNRVTDDELWFTQNQLPRPLERLAHRGAPPLFTSFPVSYENGRLLAVAPGPTHTVLLYGPSLAGGAMLVIVDAAGAFVTAFDFAAWSSPPGGAGAFTEMFPQYATVRDGVLYVTHYHRTYASSSGGHNAYVSALDLASGQLLWQTRPLVSNVQSFAVVGDVIVTGYGFTDEKDDLVVLDRATGRILHRARIESGPEHVIWHNNQLFVRSYDRDYVFDLVVR